MFNIKVMTGALLKMQLVEKRRQKCLLVNVTLIPFVALNFKTNL